MTERPSQRVRAVAADALAKAREHRARSAARRERSERSYAPLTDENLARLSELAASDHELLC